MTLNVRIMTPDKIFWSDQAQEIILPTNTGQMGVLSSHASLVTALDIGVMSIRQNNDWTFFALMNGFASIQNDQVIILVNEAESKEEIDADQAQSDFEEAQKRVVSAPAEDKKSRVEANLAFKRARTRFLITKD